MALNISSSLTKIRGGSIANITYANPSVMNVGTIVPPISTSVQMTAAFAISAAYAPGGSTPGGSGIPIGSMVVFPGNTDIDENWLACNNQIVNTSSYPELKSALDSQWSLTVRTADEYNCISSNIDMAPTNLQGTKFIQIWANYKSASLYNITTNTLTTISCSKGDITANGTVYNWSKKTQNYVFKVGTTNGVVFYIPSTHWLEYRDTSGSFISGGYVVSASSCPTSSVIFPYMTYGYYNQTASYFLSNATSSVMYINHGYYVGPAISSTGIYAIDTASYTVKKYSYSTGSSLWSSASIGINTKPVCLLNNSNGEVYFIGDRFITVLEGSRSGSSWSFDRQLSTGSIVLDDNNLLIATESELGKIYKLNLTSSGYVSISDSGSLSTSLTHQFSNVTQILSGGFFNTSDGFYAMPGYTPQSIGMGYTSSYNLKHSTKLFTTQSTYVTYPFVLLSNGDLYAFGGANTYGYLGIGTTSPSVSQSVLVSTNVTDIKTDGPSQMYYSAYKKSDNTLWGAGYNSSGWLGTGTTNTVSQSIQIASDVSSFEIVSVNNNVTLYYITSTGNLYGVGYNAYGQIGVGNLTNQLTASLIASNVQKVFPRVSGSYFTTHYLTNAGAVYGMGYNDYQQVGPIALGTSVSASYAQGTGIASGSVYTTGSVTYCVGTNGYLYGWGRTSEGQCGTVTTYTNMRIISTGVVSSSIQTNGLTTYFKLSTSNQLYGMGYNHRGQIGNGTTTNSTGYLIASNVNKFQFASATAFSSSMYYITTGSFGKLYGCGDNTNNQLGPTVSNSMSMSPILIDNAVYEVSSSVFTYNIGILYTSASNQTVILSAGKHVVPVTSSANVFNIYQSPTALILSTNGTFQYFGSSSYGYGYSSLINCTSSVESSASAFFYGSSLTSTAFTVPNNIPVISVTYTDSTKLYYIYDIDTFYPQYKNFNTDNWSFHINYSNLPDKITYVSQSQYQVSVDGGNTYNNVASTFLPYYGYIYNGVNLFYNKRKLLYDGWDGFLPTITKPANSILQNLQYYIRAK